MKKDKILLPVNPCNSILPWFWIGTWSMGGEGFGPHDERESARVLDMAAHNNIRHFDTAGFYAHGKSENLLRSIIKEKRTEFFISSKGGLVWKGRQVEHRASPEDLKKQLHESLERLQTDYLDLYQLHWPDPKVPVAESIYGLKKLQEEGLIRHWGISNLSEYDLYNNLTGEINIPHQVHFNPVHRNFKTLHSGEKECINCITSPFEQGLILRGKGTGSTDDIGKKDLRTRNPYFSDLKFLVWRNRFNDFINSSPFSGISSILMWICSQPHVHAIIPGPRKTDQMESLLSFISDMEKNNLYSSADENNILSLEKTSEVVPPDLWKHLSKGP